MNKSANLLPERLRRRMEVLGIDQAELARRCGQKPQAVSRWVQGHTVPGLDALDMLAEALNTTASELIRPISIPETSAAPREIVDIIDSAYEKNDQPLIRAVEALLLGLAAGRAESSIRSAQVPAHHRKQKK